MSKWQEVKRCKECGKIYDSGIPEICKKCGVRLGTASAFMALFGQRQVLRTNKCESVVARRTLFGWKVRENTAEAIDEVTPPPKDTPSTSGCCARSKMNGTTL